MTRVLIVEDEAAIRSLVRMTLADTGFELTEAVDAASGWEAALQTQPEIILLDIMMPGGMDGLQLCQRLKADARTQSAKVVLVTARGHRNDIGIGREAGADEYLLKPFSPQRLVELVQILANE